MKTKPIQHSSNLFDKAKCKLEIAAQKKWALDKAISRWLQRQPLVVATELTTVQPISQRNKVIEALELRRTELLKELQEVDLAISVVKQTCPR